MESNAGHARAKSNESRQRRYHRRRWKRREAAWSWKPMVLFLAAVSLAATDWNSELIQGAGRDVARLFAGPPFSPMGSPGVFVVPARGPSSLVTPLQQARNDPGWTFVQGSLREHVRTCKCETLRIARDAERKGWMVKSREAFPGTSPDRVVEVDLRPFADLARTDGIDFAIGAALRADAVSGTAQAASVEWADDMTTPLAALVVVSSE